MGYPPPDQHGSSQLPLKKTWFHLQRPIGGAAPSTSWGNGTPARFTSPRQKARARARTENSLSHTLKGSIPWMAPEADVFRRISGGGGGGGAVGDADPNFVFAKEPITVTSKRKPEGRGTSLDVFFPEPPLFFHPVTGWCMVVVGKHFSNFCLLWFSG